MAVKGQEGYLFDQRPNGSNREKISIGGDKKLTFSELSKYMSP